MAEGFGVEILGWDYVAVRELPAGPALEGDVPPVESHQFPTMLEAFERVAHLVNAFPHHKCYVIVSPRCRIVPLPEHRIVTPPAGGSLERGRSDD